MHSLRGGLRLLAEGKTKIIQEVPGETDVVRIISKDDITAGDGARHDVIPGKGAWSNQTTCDVFRLLESQGVLLAFYRQLDDVSFLARRCKMVPFEVVVRREAHGSFLKRNPKTERGQRFEPLVPEIYLKTSGRQWRGVPIPVDDPFVIYEADGSTVHLFHPQQPLSEQAPFLSLPVSDVVGRADYDELFERMKSIAIRTFRVLEDAWARVGGTLIDFKVEFGFEIMVGAETRKLLLADVIDNDSWRVLWDGEYIDKQVYRNGGTLDEVAACYQQVASLVSEFWR